MCIVDVVVLVIVVLASLVDVSVAAVFSSSSVVTVAVVALVASGEFVVPAVETAGVGIVARVQVVVSPAGCFAAVEVELVAVLEFLHGCAGLNVAEAS